MSIKPRLGGCVLILEAKWKMPLCVIDKANSLSSEFYPPIYNGEKKIHQPLHLRWKLGVYSSHNSHTGKWPTKRGHGPVNLGGIGRELPLVVKHRKWNWRLSSDWSPGVSNDVHSFSGQISLFRMIKFHWPLPFPDSKVPKGRVESFRALCQKCWTIKEVNLSTGSGIEWNTPDSASYFLGVLD